MMKFFKLSLVLFLVHTTLIAQDLTFEEYNPKSTLVIPGKTLIPTVIKVMRVDINKGMGYSTKYRCSQSKACCTGLLG